MLIQVKYPMPSIGHHIWNSTNINNMWEHRWNILLSDINTIRWETEKHFQRRYVSTELQCIEWLALEMMKYALECSEHLVFKPFLVTMIQNINVWTHLALTDHNQPQELPVVHTVVTITDKNTWEK